MKAGLAELCDAERDKAIRGAYQTAIDRLDALAYRLAQPRPETIGKPPRRSILVEPEPEAALPHPATALAAARPRGDRAQAEAAVMPNRSRLPVVDSCLIRWPRRPPLHPDVLADLERRGVPAVTAILSHLSVNDAAGLPLKPEHQSAYTLRVDDISTSTSVTRAEVESWLRWKSEQTDFWTKTGWLLTLVAAIASVFAAIEGWPATK